MKYQLVNVEQQELLAKGICERVGSAEAFHKHGLDKNEESSMPRWPIMTMRWRSSSNR